MFVWFTPNAGALTRTPELSAPRYDEAVAVLVVVLGDGITLDTFEGNPEDPLSLHKYLYTGDNAVNCTDPTGLKTYLVCFGEDISSLFVDGAKAHASGIKKWKGFDPTRDKVVIAKTYTVEALEAALFDNTDIAWIAYIGHGGPGALYLGRPSGSDYNLSPFGGQADEASDSTPVAILPTQNVRKDAKAALFSCYSAAGDTTTQGGVSIAQAFADHFGIPVLGAGAGVSFNKSGPYIRRWRIAYAFNQSIWHSLTHGRGWTTVTPDFISPVVP